jgi:hypothetical protein
MDGPEHYRKAEQLADEAHEISAQAHEQRAALLAEAQVHATLAGVAVAMQTQLGGSYHLDFTWRDLLGIPEA